MHLVEGPEPAADGTVAVPRLVRHTLHLADGHQVQVAIAGRGVPLVVVHGFTAEGFLYAQTLSRLVSSGFKVVAIDTAGHGGTAGLTGDGGGDLASYAELAQGDAVKTVYAPGSVSEPRSREDFSRFRGTYDPRRFLQG